MLKLEKLDKTFQPGTANAHHALRDLSLTLEDGEFVTVIGSNGAGKSTLLGAVSGAFFVDSGHILLDGRDLTYVPGHKRARDDGELRGTVKSAVSSYLFKNTKRSPMVIPVVTRL